MIKADKWRAQYKPEKITKEEVQNFKKNIYNNRLLHLLEKTDTDSL